MHKSVRPILATAIWFGCFAAGAAFAASDGIKAGVTAPLGKNVFAMVDMNGKTTYFEAIKERKVSTIDNACQYKVFSVHKWTEKKDPVDNHSVWVRNDKTTINVSEGELGQVASEFAVGGEAASN